MDDSSGSWSSSRFQAVESSRRAERGLRAPSLRARLTGLLLLAVFAVACVQAAITYRAARAGTEAVFDAQMQRVALSLSGTLAMSAPDQARGPEDFIIQVWRADGLMLYRSPTARLLPPQAVLGFSDARVGGRAYRVYALQTPLQVVQVAQAMADRQRLAERLALRAVLPVAALAPILMLIVWGVVTRALAPVERVRRQAAARRADDLAPLPIEGLPAELRPLVDEMNALLARVAAAWALLANFSGGAAHELRTPLAALRLQAQALQRAASPEARQIAVERLLAGIDRATRLVEQLLALARQEGGGAGSPAFAAVDVAQLAQRAVADAQAQAESAGVALQWLPPNAAVQIQGDADALAILLRNLIENALRYTPPGGQVRVAAGAEQNSGQPSAWLAVEDSGPGIPPEERGRVLEPFYRAPSAIAQNGIPGSGLGLAIVRAVVARHGGELTLDDAPGLGGLRVTVRLPGIR
ncbi:MAG: sensor histidine kinase N-terminal domain-containing protein [Burkholderiaceae bacterium]|jgi:two-component system OmpR family sensor kinase|nr:sensor histidine kinase N-terminal domain-containing protein [Burkholderiaceae bacterium]